MDADKQVTREEPERYVLNQGNLNPTAASDANCVSGVDPHAHHYAGFQRCAATHSGRVISINAAEAKTLNESMNEEHQMTIKQPFGGVWWQQAGSVLGAPS